MMFAYGPIIGDDFLKLIGGFFIIAIISISLHVFFSYCLKRICLKAGHEPGALVWIPVAQFVPMLNIAGLPLWYIILLLVPLVNILAFLHIWRKIVERLGHGIGFFIGIVFLHFIFVPLLAFGHSPNQVEKAQ